jgi:hypothetical protein
MRDLDIVRNIVHSKALGYIFGKEHQIVFKGVALGAYCICIEVNSTEDMNEHGLYCI